jgi:hypothetical protein
MTDGLYNLKQELFLNSTMEGVTAMVEKGLSLLRDHY